MLWARGLRRAFEDVPDANGGVWWAAESTGGGYTGWWLRRARPTRPSSWRPGPETGRHWSARLPRSTVARFRGRGVMVTTAGWSWGAASIFIK